MGSARAAAAGMIVGGGPGRRGQYSSQGVASEEEFDLQNIQND
jgi:hypothetical protein